MRILIAGPNPAVRCQENVAFLGTATGENLQKILVATKLRPEIFAYGNFYPHPTPRNGPLTKEQTEIAVVNAAYYLACYDGVIALGNQARDIMRRAEGMYSLGEWTSIPHPSPRNRKTNDKEFINDSAQVVNSFVFRVFASLEQTRQGIRSGTESSEPDNLAYGAFGLR